MVVRRARLVPRIVLPWRVVICALGHDVSCSLALGNPVWGDGHYRPSCAPRPRLSSAHLSPSHGPGPPCPPPNPVGRGRILLLEILQITLSAEPFLAAVGVPRGGWCRADCASRVPGLPPWTRVTAGTLRDPNARKSVFWQARAFAPDTRSVAAPSTYRFHHLSTTYRCLLAESRRVRCRFDIYSF